MQKYIILLLAVVLTILSCRKDEDFIMDSNAQLEFSVDTLRFDTVFTTLGSATRIVKLYNTHNQPIQISRISVENGENSVFRFNIDGIPTNEATNVEIAANDSLYIFGEVTIDPDADISESPFVIEDNLVFETNGNTQKVLLEAWGQNANYIPNRFNQGGIALLSCDFGEIVWDDPKPYVIYGVLVVDSCALRLPAGTRIYVHGGIATTTDVDDNLTFYNDGLLFFLNNGRLISEGTLNDPVIIQGDRLEEPFQEIAGQWSGIRMSAGSQNNRIDHTIIRSSIVGIRVDSAADLTIKNSQIYNTAGAGLLGIHGQIDAENCLIYNNGSNSVQLEYGGVYNFDYCTLASYGVDASALRMTNVFCLDQFCQDFRFNALTANWRNSIIFGSRADEIDLFDVVGDQLPNFYNYDFENCIVRVDELTDEEGYENFFDFCNPCINAVPSDALFVDANEDDYHLDTLSIAEQQAIPISTIPLDLEGINRDGATPDIGCYEYVLE